ncbi:hypothetical protein IMY05_005G0168200 [Salix suchowensis]|nr:hypothetical protein IMY05_005G0168200 [Salix suchowensis]
MSFFVTTTWFFLLVALLYHGCARMKSFIFTCVRLQFLSGNSSFQCLLLRSLLLTINKECK